ncbi:MAG: hypothetical protein AAFX46_20525 [Cyanobacteria bacterium J06636_27]
MQSNDLNNSHSSSVIAKYKQVRGDEGYRSVIHSRFVYEYCDGEGFWFDINPLLAEAVEFQKS